MKNKSTEGFTLMEMLIVVTIIGILAAIVVPRFIASSSTARKNAHRAERQMINSQLELYYFVFGEYPGQMSNEGWGSSDKDNNGKVDWTEYFPDGVPTACNIGTAWGVDNGRIVPHGSEGGSAHE